MKKILASMMCFIIVCSVIILSGCSNNKEGKKELTMLVPGYDSGYLKAELDAAITDFNEKSDVDVKVMSVGWEELNSKIIQLYKAGQSPDIMLTGTRSLRLLKDKEVIADLSSYVDDQFEDERVLNVYKTAEIDGKQYGIPMAISSRALYYRSDLIKNPPTNWDELLKVAKSVHEKNSEIYGFALPTDYESGTDELLNFFYQNNGKMIDSKGEYTLNTKENIQTLEYLKQFNKENVIPNPISTKRSDLAKMFINGDLAMFISGPWEKAELDKNINKTPFKVVILPEGNKKSVNLVTDSYVISSQSENKEKAWEFIKFMGQEKYQRTISESFDFFPTLKAEQNDERFKNEFIKPFKNIIPYGVAEPSVKNWDKYNKIFIEAVQKALTGKESAEKSLDNAQKELMLGN